MATITKHKEANKWLQSYTIIPKNGTSNYSYMNGASVDHIEYDKGPKSLDGHCIWKRCTHQKVTSMSGLAYEAVVDHDIFGQGMQFGSVAGLRPYTASGFTPLPDIRDLFDAFYDEVDMNCSDGVLLYSGILQAVPLVGGAMKGVSLFNRAAKKLTKSFRAQPFTTVVKQLIQADFIDRFVVSPTLDDMRKFADASNYVLRCLGTIRSRNAELYTAFEQTATRIGSKDSRDFFYDDQGYRWYLHAVTENSATAKLKVIAKVTYDQKAIDPIKLWAARIGLTRPLDSVWDLIPFSFIIDYFTRAGDLIQHWGDKLSNQDALTGRVARIHDVWLMTTQKNNRIVTCTGVEKRTPRPITLRFWKPGEVRSGNVKFSRLPVSVYSERSFWEREGFVSPHLSSTRARTIAELIMQATL